VCVPVRERERPGGEPPPAKLRPPPPATPKVLRHPPQPPISSSSSFQTPAATSPCFLLLSLTGPTVVRFPSSSQQPNHRSGRVLSGGAQLWRRLATFSGEYSRVPAKPQTSRSLCACRFSDQIGAKGRCSWWLDVPAGRKEK
jgi:hypothetical protein